MIPFYWNGPGLARGTLTMCVTSTINRGTEPDHWIFGEREQAVQTPPAMKPPKNKPHGPARIGKGGKVKKW